MHLDANKLIGDRGAEAVQTICSGEQEGRLTA
jgi:hypothetical protein